MAFWACIRFSAWVKMIDAGELHNTVGDLKPSLGRQAMHENGLGFSQGHEFGCH